MTLFIGILLGLLALAAIGLKRAYESTSVKQLKKRARSGDKTAELLHRSVAYGPSLHFILWSLVCVTSAGFFVFVSRSTEAWFAALLCIAVLWLGFIWLPKRRASSLGIWVAAKLSPLIAKLASFLHPVVRRVSHGVRSLFPVHVHSGLYDEDDLIALLEKQKQQADNQIPDSALEIAEHSLTYASVEIRDVLIPRRAVKMVSVDETTGPVFMDELHQSGFSRFPVHGEKKDDIVGILFLRDLVRTRHSGKVKSIMSTDVLYIHEEQTLEDALSAILKTHQHLFIVVNSFEEYVGILTIEDVFERILGKQIVDEFDQYENMRAVATLAAKKNHQETQHAVDR
ncbi:MAG: CBS domain-containing protein [Candidatus Saccharibacteria bacterium]|nr:CBS domain-containing protein [Candidatus Saccharibacteria bacterium]